MDAAKASQLLPLSLALAVAANLFCGCSSNDPLPDTGFLKDSELMKKDSRVPAEKVWKNPGVKVSASYDKIYVASVRTDMQVKKSFLERTNFESVFGNAKKADSEFAQYMQDAFKKEIKERCRMKLADTPGPRTLALEMSISKIVPGHPILATAGLLSSATPIGLIVLPIKIGAKATSDTPTQSSLIVEGRVVDSETGLTVGMFVQKSKQCVSIINFEDFTSYGNLREIADAWAKTFVDTVNAKPFETGATVEGSMSRFKPFNL